MIYADFDYYKDAYLGGLISNESEYERLATRAATEIDYYTLGRAYNQADTDAVKMCACAVAEQFLTIAAAQATSTSDAELQSESVGSYSRTYRASADRTATARAEIRNIINRYLATTGLLYRGVMTCIHHTS